MKPAIRIMLIVSSFMFFGGCASLADVKGIDKRISNVEAENKNLISKIQTLSDELDRQKELYASHDAEIYQFKEESQKLNGRLDETEYKFNQEKKAWDNSIQNFRDSISRLSESSAGKQGGQVQQQENIVGIAPQENPEAQKTAQPPSGGDVSEEELYRLAKDAYDQKDFTTSRQHFEKFLVTYPNSNIADNARFWMGEVYFSEGWYQKAILEYQEVIEKYPKGNKVPAAYLKQGISFFKLGENANAKLVLNELIKRFPESTEADTAKQQIKQIP